MTPRIPGFGYQQVTVAGGVPTKLTLPRIVAVPQTVAGLPATGCELAFTTGVTVCGVEERNSGVDSTFHDWLCDSVVEHPRPFGVISKTQHAQANRRHV